MNSLSHPLQCIIQEGSIKSEGGMPLLDSLGKGYRSNTLINYWLQFVYSMIRSKSESVISKAVFSFLKCMMWSSGQTLIKLVNKL